MNLSQPRSLQAIVLALLVIGLIALALSGYLAPLTRVVLNPLISAQTWLATRFQAIQTALTAPQDLASLRLQNQQLAGEVSRLQAELIDMEQQISQTRVLSALVDFARVRPENRYVAAAVIGRDPSPFLQYVIINRGSDDGLRRGMPVVTSQGLVGRVAAVISGAARVQLISDADSTINVRLGSARTQAVLRGTVTGEVNLEMIPQSATLQGGDLVLTSGIGGNYPPDILIGQVSGVRKHENELYQRAAVQPVVDFNQLEIVLVITNFRPVDISPLIPTPVGP